LKLQLKKQPHREKGGIPHAAGEISLKDEKGPKEKIFLVEAGNL